MEGRPADDSSLVSRAQRGDEAAYEEIVQLYQQVAFRTAYVITGSAADAEDAAQEGFVKAYRALGRFRAGAEWRPWLLRIVANEARNRVRSSGRRHRLELRLTEGFRPGDAAPSPEAVAVALDERKRLLAMVNALSDEARAVIASRYSPELNGEETAAPLGLPEGTVKSRPSPLPPGPPGRYLNLGTQVSLAEARQGVAWTILLPAALGSPDAVYLQQPPSVPSGGEVSLVYVRSDIKTSGLTGVSVLVTEARGRVDERYFQKTLGPGVTIEQVTVNGHSGYWISGRPHQFVITDAEGNPYPETLRLATNTLVIDEG